MDTLKSMTDEELAFAYINGNNRAFDELLSRTQDKLFNYIMYVVKDEDLANDLFQEAFLKVITKMQHGRYTVNGTFLWQHASPITSSSTIIGISRAARRLSQARIMTSRS